MTKKGFSLIELLAVIIIIAIISLIAAPVVLHIIDNSKKEAAKRSIEGVISSAKNFCALKIIENESINSNVEVNCINDRNLCIVSHFNEELKIDGEIPDGYFILSKLCNINPDKETALTTKGYSVSIAKNKITSIKKTTEVSAITYCNNNICEVDSIIQGIANLELPNGNYTLKVGDKLYPIEFIRYKNDTVINENTAFGDDSAEYKTLIVKFDNDLTINSGVNITANTNDGYTYKKGMYIYANGTLTNNGTITMTARGTYNLAGEETILWKNSDNSYEVLPAVGAKGGTGRTAGSTLEGNPGGIGVNRATGGGSINIFYKENYISGTITATGGTGGTQANGKPGGAGGNGSITVCNIVNGSCILK